MSLGDSHRMADDEHERVETEHARPRKRTKRACDKCSSSRTRCNGDYPCGRCSEYGYTCRYNREVKKRGRLPGSVSHASSNAQSRQNGHRSNSKSSPPLTSPISGGMPTSLPLVPESEESASPYEPVGHGMDVPNARRDSFVRPHRPSLSMSVGSIASHSLQSQHGQTDEGYGEEAVIAEDHVSPPKSVPIVNGNGKQHRPSFHSTTSYDAKHIRESFSTTGHDDRMQDYLQQAPTEDCRYPFLNPVLPYIRNVIPASVACDLLDIFLTDPGSSLFRGASPYILTRIFRKKSILDPTNPRDTTPALLATILWCVAQTADVMLLHVPGSRARIVNELYDLATALVSQRDPDRWRRTHGGLVSENEIPHPSLPTGSIVPSTTAANEPAGAIDDVLTFILLSIAVSGSDFKSDCYKWWSKATRLAFSLRLNREDERCTAPVSPCANPLCSCHKDQEPLTLQNLENREERRRVFWLLYSLDRHLSLSFNTIVSIPDSYCEVLSPLPESIWEELDSVLLTELPPRVIGPPVISTGTEFFEYFLPLMAILGDIIEVHHRRRHPRLGELEDAHSIAVISKLLADYELSLETLTTESALTGYSTSPVPLLVNGDRQAPLLDYQRARLVKAYSTHILHVLHVLLHGKWDAISMLDDGDDWITSKRFAECASHAISASQSVSTILTIDPELTFMSYLFGIYLLQGSFILLLFADRMPQLGLNESVEQACENIIRAHEVCVVTLSTEFQKNFRRVVRSTLYSVRGAGTTNWEEHKARRRALSLYRWTKGAKGLAL